MKNKTNRKLRKILSIALCLALVMSYVPMTSLTAFAADDYAVVDTEAGTVTIDGTLGGKTTATKDEVNALVEQLKAYVDNGITTIIVPGTEHAMYESALGTIPAYAEALYLLTNLNKDIPYCGTIDLILPDATEIIDFSFDSVDALKSITLPKVTTVGDGAFYGCRYLEKMTFGSVITEVVEIKSGVFASLGIKSDNEACDLVLNCGQLNAEDKYKPNLESNVWYIGEWSGETEWKSITFGTHVSGADGACDCGAGVVAEVEYGDTATYYATLADALAVAQYRSGANVYALMDCNDDFTIPASVSFYGRDNSFGGNVTNKGDIREGTFNGEVTNEQFIHGGTFNGTVINHDTIVGGTFNGKVTNYDRIYDHFDDDRFSLGDDFTIENNGTISCDYHHWKDGVCRLCAYACTHADGTAANCTSGPICSVCGYEYGEALGHTIVEGSYADNSNGTHSFTCSVCGNVTEEHSGGTATCTTQAVCEACGASYGDVDLTKHDEYINGFCPLCDSYQPTTQNEDGYYEIGNAGQLYWFAEQVNAGNTGYNAILLNDIIVNENILVDGELNTDTDTVASFRQWTAIGNDTTQYIGTFDGQGYEIKGLYINSAEKQNLGLFGYLGAGAVVKNLGVVDGYFADTSINSSYGGGDSCYGGGIATYANKATISKCYNTCTIKTGGDVGGIVGRNYSSRIEYCYNAGNVICTAASNAPWYPAAGGIAGGNYSTATSYEIIYSCYNIGTISSGFYYIGSINGSLTGYPSQNCYYLSATDNGKGGKTAEQFASGEVAYLLQQGNTEQVWGQDNNQAGATPVFDATGLYKVVTVGETGNYSVANVGDTNGDGTVDVTDYQALVNMAVSEGHSQTETASYDDIIKYDLVSDGYIDVLDAQLMNLLINGYRTIDVYAVGDYNRNGKAFEEADIFAMAEAMKAPEDLETHEKYACDINGDGKVSYDDLNTLTSMFPLYFVGEA